MKGNNWLEKEDFNDIDRVNIKTIMIRDGISIIKDHVFEGFVNLEEIYLPSTIEQYDPTAFDDCPNLRNVRWPGDEKDVENDKEVEIPESIQPAIPMVPWTVAIILLVVLIFVISYLGDEIKAKDEIIAELRSREISSEKVETKNAEELIRILKTLDADKETIELAQSIRDRLARLD